MVDLSSVPGLDHSGVPSEDGRILFLVFLALVSKWPSCGTSRENQTWHRPAGTPADVAQPVVGVAVAGVVFVAESVGYN